MDIIDHFYEECTPYGELIPMLYNEKCVGYFSVLKVRQDDTLLIGFYDYLAVSNTWPPYELKNEDTIEIQNKIIYEIRNYLSIKPILNNCILIHPD